MERRREKEIGRGRKSERGKTMEEDDEAGMKGVRYAWTWG